jgi:acetyl esterase/lipase
MNHPTALILLTLILLAAGTARAQRIDYDVQYGTEQAQTLDLYHPATPGPAPLIVFLHGGGWQGGDKKLGRRLAPPLVAAGYAVASLNYTLWPKVPPSGELKSAALGIAYLLHNAAVLGLKTNQFAIMGHSSGSGMAALLGTDSAYLRNAGVDPDRLAAVVTLDGVFDVKTNLTHFPNEHSEAPFGKDQSRWVQYSPVQIMDRMAGRPRFCVVHEDVFPKYIEQAGLLEAALRQHGKPLDTETVHGLRHGELAYKFPDAGEPMAPFVLACLAKAFRK